MRIEEVAMFRKALLAIGLAASLIVPADALTGSRR
jgi:hypothetical protein